MAATENVNFNQFRVNKTDCDVVDGDVQVVGFTRYGKDIDPSDPECHAKKATDPATGNSRYWIKRAGTGQEAGRMYNPVTADYGATRRFDTALGRPRYEFRPVNEETFTLYVNFLKTENLAFLRNAERQ